MRTKFLLLITLTFVGVLSLSAKPPHHHPGISPSEDMRFIQAYIRDEKAAELAGVLALSDDQVAQLREARAAADMIAAEHDPGIDAAREALDHEAAAVRASIEAGNELTQEQRDSLRTLKQAVGQAHRAKREDQKNSLSGLRDLLTEEQRDAMREFAAANRPERPEGAEAGPEQEGGPAGDRAGRRGPRNGGPRGGDRMHGKIARVLLSDAFLNQYN
ncbi:hypothetical protein [Acanthopleuribacter pedis]|uniref:Uncharacterized protein n=1 Tax=Acanthopleuribacter pedis TaxID=442870 RepID=A0A8J7Q1R1_9BACT|nr:hypothetical protein [Acanthopleuribacter pedis]MBO1317655.1 hypothetical protein [Acanthopleuribacter pedis]